jgi:hypothetical protein
MTAFALPSHQESASVARSCAVVDRSEQLARLAYELLDALADTEALLRVPHAELMCRAHLDYLRGLQRAGREVLARAA